jgi:3-oxoacyl-[acyl-carrier protein] reductase
MTRETKTLADRVALVLGRDEIGNGIATRLTRAGAAVTIHEPDRQTPADIGALVAGLVRTPARLDILVCNLLPAAFETQGDALLAAAFDRVRLTVAAMRAALPHLRAAGAGRIILIGHRYGESVSEAIGAYNAAAWSLVGVTRTAAVEWGQYQITTNLLLPLARTAEFATAHARRPAILDLLLSQLPLRRIGDPIEDVGGAALFLASDEACFINGQVIHADGGQHVAGPLLNPARFAS